jgi:Flp pilus assembly pilin Flp
MKHIRCQNETLKACLLRFLHSECGAMQVAEYLLMGTIITLGVVVGLATYRDSVVLEYGDASAALQSIRQTYSFTLTGGTTSSFNDGATNLSNSVGVSVNGSPEP